MIHKNLRTYVTVDLEIIKSNLCAIKSLLTSGTKIMAIVKADGYGHGAVEICKYIEPYVGYYGVATIDEAIELRRAGIKIPILVLGYTLHSRYKDLLQYEIEQTIYSLEDAMRLNEEGEFQIKKAGIHIAVDTGMGRIGFIPDSENADLVKEISLMSNLEIKGLFTHFAIADEKDKDYTVFQVQSYNSFVKLLNQRNVEILFNHVSNSAAIIDMNEYQFNMVRAGIILYGLYPSNEVQKGNILLKPALEWKARVVHIKEVPVNTCISYGKTYITKRNTTRIATINIGYADGYSRGLSNKGRVLIKGKSYPIVGRICMDQFMVDISNSKAGEIEMEEIVTLIGKDGEEYISADELADMDNTINYEIICNISKRVPRLYIY